MRKWTDPFAGLFALALLVTCDAPLVAHAMAQDTPIARDLASHRAALIAQCPPVLHMSVEQREKLPIHVTRWGSTGPRVLIIHGGEQILNAIGGGPKNWSEQKALGEQGWQLLLPDRPGFGDSPTRGPDDQQADAVWIAQMLGDGANLWGHSFGGAEALLAAAKHPEAVKSLILVEPDLWPMAEVSTELNHYPPIEAELTARRHMLMEASSPADYATRFLESFQPAKSGFKVTVMRTIVSWIPGLSSRIGCGALTAHEATGEEFLKAADAVVKARVPVLVITGGWSPPRDALGELAAHILHGRHVIVPSTNHIVMAANPTVFNALVSKFMRDADKETTRGAERPSPP